MKRVACIVVLIACQKSTDSPSQIGGATAEAPLRELIEATQTREASKMRHALVSPDRLQKALDCPPSAQILREHEQALAALEQAADALKGASAKAELLSIKQTAATKVARGDNFRDCKATEPFEVRSFAMKLRMTLNGSAMDDEDTGDVILLDGRWYALLKR